LRGRTVSEIRGWTRSPPTACPISAASPMGCDVSTRSCSRHSRCLWAQAQSRATSPGWSSSYARTTAAPDSTRSSAASSGPC